jgi:indole-3-glycerol phosphate synthase
MAFLDAIVRHKRAELEERRRAVPQASLEARCRALPPPRDLEQALRPRAGGVRLIAEVKKASPSRGVLTEALDPVALARQYAGHGADAISVVTDAKYFQGSLEALATIRGSVEVPLLRKDFTLDEYHLWEARAAGADAVLLIVAILEPARLRALLRSAAGLGLAALVECHTAAEVAAALSAGARLVGINNRDLHTFDTRLETTLELLPLIPPGPIRVSESGFFTGADVRRVVAAGVHAVLVGEALVRAPDVGAKIAELTLREPAAGSAGAPGAAGAPPGRPRGAGAPAPNADG